MGSVDPALSDWLVDGHLGAGVTALDGMVGHRRRPAVSGDTGDGLEGFGSNAWNHVGRAKHRPGRAWHADYRGLHLPVVEEADPLIVRLSWLAVSMKGRTFRLPQCSQEFSKERRICHEALLSRIGLNPLDGGGTLGVMSPALLPGEGHKGNVSLDKVNHGF